MTDHTKVNTLTPVHPKIYAWSTPDVPKYKGWLKIGYTEKQTVEKRISQQASQMKIDKKIEWHYDARFQNGGWFTDKAFHRYLKKNQIPEENGTEWFDFRPEKAKEKSKDLFQKFVFQDYATVQKLEKTLDYTLRAEQVVAVDKTLAYLNSGVPDRKFLWNAKPRFGKTLTTYDFIRKSDAINVLIVTNRPAIANAWYDDFEKFIAWQTDYLFVSSSESLKDRPALSREEYLKAMFDNENTRQLAFLSLQDLKGSQYFGGAYDKLKWVKDTDWDLLVIDEAHEGVDTSKTDTAFRQLKRNFTLHLSGTPFKAIAGGDFSDAQIYNWSYEDEQRAKADWSDVETNNPYENRPKLNLFTYQMSQMMTDEINKGAAISDDGGNADYAFDLNLFFETKDDGNFVHQDEVVKWLDTLTKGEKYPFSTPELREELKHTFWLLNRVASAKALEKLLKKHPVFENYEIILAAGDGKTPDDTAANLSSFNKVKQAVKSHDKTITLSVGQLTTGVTIPEWTAVMMLSNMKSPSLYMQAAFRAQNPWSQEVNGQLYQKENAYIFDFAPERTLIIFDEFANNLSRSTANGAGTHDSRAENIKNLLNFFPVIAEDSDGKMVELDSTQVLTIPKALKAQEVVKRGFMSNLLFANISNIFQNLAPVRDILDKMNTAKDDLKPVRKVKVAVDESGEIAIPEDIVISKTDAVFGTAIYEQADYQVELADDTQTRDSVKVAESFSKPVIENIFTPETLNTLTADHDQKTISKAFTTNLVKEAEKTLTKVLAVEIEDNQIEQKRVVSEFDEKIQQAVTSDEKHEIEQTKTQKLTDLTTQLQETIKEVLTEKVPELAQKAVEKVETKVEEKKKSSVEDDVRDHLRGFARTIPSFIMAYGDDHLTLENFENYTPDDVFLAVTSITETEFRFLRDGGDYTDEDGETQHYAGGLFDAQVFNTAIQEFLNKKRELANYFDDSLTEDIFDYIPPQKTNQIFTPKAVVKLMVDKLEVENPDIFKDSTKTFADLYMKSGLYMTEIVTRLYAGLAEEIPDDAERLRHILEKQVYGFAPSEIIYNIAVNYIFGFAGDEISKTHFVNCDTIPYVKAGKLEGLLLDTFDFNN
ncbi:DEAD/DEAH box helicase family protein [Pseudolactococcus yaeyamensis]